MIAYLTDVEGMWSKLASFADENPCVRFDDGGRLRVVDDATFVFGGDAIDRGPEGRRVVDTLLEAHHHDPRRVVLLAGNRDINKLRLVRELSGHPPSRAPEEVRGDRPTLLRWIFRTTMGAAGAFEFRRQELVHEGRPSTDEDVVDSFLADLRQGGPLQRYLSACRLAYRSGVTLFVHGGVLRENLGVVPGRARVDGVDAWVRALNHFFDTQMDAYVNDLHDADGRPMWTDLVSYQAPHPGTRSHPESVVYSRPADALNNPILPSHDVIAALAEEGIHRVVLGHTPNGDCPSVVRFAGEPGFELVVADNSHARHATGSSVLLTDDAIEVRGEVVLDDRTTAEVRYRLARNDAESPIGRVTADTGHLVQGRLVDGRYLLYKALPDYATEHVAVDADALRTRGLVTAPCV